MNVILTRMMENPMMAIEEAAANCYDSKPSEDGLIAMDCYESGHHSVLEFVNFTFYIEGVSRALLAQLTRHRHAGYAVRSQRYCKENSFPFVISPSIEANTRLKSQYLEIVYKVNSLYTDLIADGIPVENARYLLPNACETRLEMTINLRSLIHLMNERLCSRTQWEFRKLANKMRELVVEKCPKLGAMLVSKCKVNEIYRYCTEHKSCGRHPKLVEVYSHKVKKEGD
ncbi:MAG: FAD-dependent thymidylate synthase [Clostridiales bacterium]|jgi:thymidylate synthase (FAD)|nr:FAD-dependent thymidylate synthase [Clostridiales bacterium]